MSTVTSRELSLLIDILRNVKRFKNWVLSRQNSTPLLSELQECLGGMDIHATCTVHEFMEALQKEVNSAEVTDEEEGCPLNGILVSTFQCLQCNIEWTKTTSPLFITIMKNTDVDTNTVQKAVVSFLEAHFSSRMQCKACNKDLMVINEYLFAPKILCVELTHLDVPLQLEENVFINGSEYECIATVAQRDQTLFSARKVADKSWKFSEDVGGLKMTDDIKYVFFKAKDYI
ncbi:hypothetical protein EIN_485550 [Entamoeba invadens IP1]|uniref:USP domain-containing protein n=1 Tax=Entamoeba invadens IP1 TaxID=370355 RepID=A0A0A1UAE4_ENTIV|nr:hypothetical protein EIN_485550 [Entamoeba invadens IP1]ELP89163.1 hypothetical protein EIN_485550 [Entamoeba invadens IP1]|eukprot:XP_004255934.1 hypothetical protein EIN_485550 [Entamoeba invadens IP1]